MLLECRTAEGVKQNLQRGVGANFVQGLAFVLEDFFTRHVFCVQDAAFGRAVHVLNQIPRQRTGQQCVLLFDKGAGSGIGQVLDGLAAQDRQFTST
ncbi:hypothetical protein D3C84_771760 [compost metagenome]